MGGTGLGRAIAKQIVDTQECGPCPVLRCNPGRVIEFCVTWTWYDTARHGGRAKDIACYLGMSAT